MRGRGVLYDVGRVLWGNWRADFKPMVVRRELGNHPRRSTAAQLVAFAQ
jgi:hypothetical protein